MVIYIEGYVRRCGLEELRLQTQHFGITYPFLKADPPSYIAPLYILLYMSVLRGDVCSLGVTHFLSAPL